ncbi:unnamed protein product [Closterium sp. NIES-53]
MEVPHTSMIYAAAPHFLLPFVVRYATHQLNLWPRVSVTETLPTLLWTGEVGDGSAFRVWGLLALVRDTIARKLYFRIVRCVFLGFPTVAPGWQFYHPAMCHVLSSQNVTFDESVSYHRLFPPITSLVPPPSPLFQVLAPPQVDRLPPQGPAPSDSGALGGGDTEGADYGGAGSGGADSGGAGSGGADSGGVECPSGGRVKGSPTRVSPGALPPLQRRPLYWEQRRSSLPLLASKCDSLGGAGAGGDGAGGSGAGGAGASGAGAGIYFAECAGARGSGAGGAGASGSGVGGAGDYRAGGSAAEGATQVLLEVLLQFEA